MPVRGKEGSRRGADNCAQTGSGGLDRTVAGPETKQNKRRGQGNFRLQTLPAVFLGAGGASTWSEHRPRTMSNRGGGKGSFQGMCMALKAKEEKLWGTGGGEEQSGWRREGGEERCQSQRKTAAGSTCCRAVPVPPRVLSQSSAHSLKVREGPAHWAGLCEVLGTVLGELSI